MTWPRYAIDAGPQSPSVVNEEEVTCVVREENAVEFDGGEELLIVGRTGLPMVPRVKNVMTPPGKEAAQGVRHIVIEIEAGHAICGLRRH
jgi:hypothetical protein